MIQPYSFPIVWYRGTPAVPLHKGTPGRVVLLRSRILCHLSRQLRLVPLRGVVYPGGLEGSGTDRRQVSSENPTQISRKTGYPAIDGAVSDTFRRDNLFSLRSGACGGTVGETEKNPKKPFGFFRNPSVFQSGVLSFVRSFAVRYKGQISGANAALWGSLTAPQGAPRPPPMVLCAALCGSFLPCQGIPRPGPQGGGRLPHHSPRLVRGQGTSGRGCHRGAQKARFFPGQGSFQSPPFVTRTRAQDSDCPKLDVRNSALGSRGLPGSGTALPGSHGGPLLERDTKAAGFLSRKEERGLLLVRI